MKAVLVYECRLCGENFDGETIPDVDGKTSLDVILSALRKRSGIALSTLVPATKQSPELSGVMALHSMRGHIGLADFVGVRILEE